jgi:hypothetical protein
MEIFDGILMRLRFSPCQRLSVCCDMLKNNSVSLNGVKSRRMFLMATRKNELKASANQYENKRYNLSRIFPNKAQITTFLTNAPLQNSCNIMPISSILAVLQNNLI